MISVKAEVEIARDAQSVWDYVSRIDRWWLASNPRDHIELSFVDGADVEEGAEFVLRERIAGVRGEARAIIAEVQPPWRLVWKSLWARFSYLGVGLDIDEGGTFEIVETDTGCILSHYVWGRLGEGRWPRVMEWFFKTVLRGEKKDYEHTRRELMFIKLRLEARRV